MSSPNCFKKGGRLSIQWHSEYIDQQAQPFKYSAEAGGGGHWRNKISSYDFCNFPLNIDFYFLDMGQTIILTKKKIGTDLVKRTFSLLLNIFWILSL